MPSEKDSEPGLRTSPRTSVIRLLRAIKRDGFEKVSAHAPRSGIERSLLDMIARFNEKGRASESPDASQANRPRHKYAVTPGNLEGLASARSSKGERK